MTYKPKIDLNCNIRNLVEKVTDNVNQYAHDTN